MSTLIKNLKNNRKLVFDKGRFDDLCIYVVEADGRKYASRDSIYFADLQGINRNYPDNKIYSDFVRIYEQTTSAIDENVLTLIDEIVDTYAESDRIIMEQWFAAIYGGMIAEERKAGIVLRKRMKRLGMYRLLILNMNPVDAANSSRGKKAEEINLLMKSYGF